MQQFLQRWLNLGNDVQGVVTSRHYTMPSLPRSGYWRSIIPPCSRTVPSYFRRGSAQSTSRKSVNVFRPKVRWINRLEEFSVSMKHGNTPGRDEEKCAVCGRLWCGRIRQGDLPEHVVKSNKSDHSNAECWRRPDRKIDEIELVSEAFNIRFHWFPPGELSGIQNGLANGPLASVGSSNSQGSVRTRGACLTSSQHG